mgnify:CR=1 FL=1
MFVAFYGSIHRGFFLHRARERNQRKVAQKKEAAKMAEIALSNNRAVSSFLYQRNELPIEAPDNNDNANDNDDDTDNENDVDLSLIHI